VTYRSVTRLKAKESERSSALQPDPAFSLCPKLARCHWSRLSIIAFCQDGSEQCVRTMSSGWLASESTVAFKERASVDQILGT